MKRYRYHLTSTREQHLDRGFKEIDNYCNSNHLELEGFILTNRQGKTLIVPDTKF